MFNFKAGVDYVRLSYRRPEVINFLEFLSFIFRHPASALPGFVRYLAGAASSPAGIDPIGLEVIETAVDSLAFEFFLAAFLEDTLDILVADPSSYTRLAEDMIFVEAQFLPQRTGVQLRASMTDDIR